MENRAHGPTDSHVHRPAALAGTPGGPAEAGLQHVVVLEPRGGRPLPAHRRGRLRGPRPQPGQAPRRRQPGPAPRAAPRRRLPRPHGPRRTGLRQLPGRRHLVSGASGERRVASGERRGLRRRSLAPRGGFPHRLLQRRVRPARERAGLLRRPRRAERRSPQERQRPRPAAGRRRPDVPRGLLPPVPHRGRLAAGALPRERLLQPAAHPGGHERRRAAAGRRAVPRPRGAGARLAHPGRPHPALPARHEHPAELAGGPHHHGPPLRRRRGHAHPPGDDPGRRRRPRLRAWASRRRFAT